MIQNLTISPLVLNREEELRLAAKRLDDLINHIPVADPVLFFHGVHMVGKTTLLQAIRQMALDRQMPVAFIDFDREQLFEGHLIDDRYVNTPPNESGSGKDQGCVQLAADLLMILEQSTDVPYIKRTSLGIDPRESAVNRLIEYVRWIRGFLKPVVFIFDTLEEVPEDTFIWLQEKILAPLLEERGFFVVMAGWSNQPTLQFRWPVLRRMYSHHLRPFNKKQSEAQLQALNVDYGWLDQQLVGRNVLEITGGIPGLNKKLVEYLRSPLVAGITTGSLLQWLVEEVIFNRFRKENIEQVKEQLLAVTIFRQFDTRLLIVIANYLAQLAPEWGHYQMLNRRLARDLLRQLRDTYLVAQHPDGYGYAVPHDIRRVLDAYAQERNLERHFTIHCEAVRWFRKQVDAGDVVMVADEIYHLGGAWRDAERLRILVSADIPDGSNRLSQLQEIIEAGLNRLNDNGRTPELVEKVIAVLRSEEFHWVLEEKEIQNLVECCQQYIHEFERQL